MFMHKLKLLCIILVAICFLVIWFSREHSETSAKRLPEMSLVQLEILAKYPPYNWSQPLRDFNLTCMNSHDSLKTKFKICPHRPTANKSDFVSNTIRGNVPWEHYISKGIENFFKKYRQSTFVDIGVNVGTHALYAAALGMPVVGVEPLHVNWINIHKGVLLNEFQKIFTLLPYAVSDERKTIEIVTNLNNIAASHIIGGKRGEMAPGEKRSDPFQIKSMLLADLLPFIKTKVALLKVDVESYECHVVGKSYKFFTQLHIPVIFMETVHQRVAEPECVKGMVNFLRDIGYKYIKDAANGRNIDAPDWNATGHDFVTFPWPLDTIWSLND